jgi:hypothetical protein
MMFPAFALLSGIALFCSGAAATVTTHQVNVSNDAAGLLFNPSYIVSRPIRHYIDVALTVSLSLFQTAYVGDVVEFTFHPKNHSVTQSSFAAPCTPLQGGFDAGLCILSIHKFLTPYVFF